MDFLEYSKKHLLDEHILDKYFPKYVLQAFNRQSIKKGLVLIKVRNALLQDCRTSVDKGTLCKTSNSNYCTQHLPNLSGSSLVLETKHTAFTKPIWELFGFRNQTRLVLIHVLEGSQHFSWDVGCKYSYPGLLFVFLSCFSFCCEENLNFHVFFFFC